MGEGALAAARRLLGGTPSPRNFDRGDHRRLLKSDGAYRTGNRIVKILPEGVNNKLRPSHKKKGRTPRVRPVQTLDLDVMAKLRFFGLAVFRLAVGTRRALVRSIAMRRRVGVLRGCHVLVPTRLTLRSIGMLRSRMVHVRIAARLTLWNRTRFSRLPHVVRGRRVRPRVVLTIHCARRTIIPAGVAARS